MTSGRNPWDFSDVSSGPTASPGGVPGPPPDFLASPTAAHPTEQFGFGGFGPDPTQATDTAIQGKPPLQWLFFAIVAAAIGAVVAGVLGGAAPLAFAGWALAGPVAIGLLAVFAGENTKQQARPAYDSPTWTSTLYWAVIVVAAIGIALSAWRIADWAGRL